MNNQSDTPDIAFPPYGHFPAHFEPFTRNRNAVADFRPNDPNRQTAWETYFAATLGVINQTLWPRYDEQTGTWEGKNAPALMNEVTRADFRVFSAMEAELPGRGLFTFLKGAKSSVVKQHHFLYLQEDGQNRDDPRFPQVNDYDREIGDKIVTETHALFAQALGRKENDGIASVGLQFKKQLQRPRPYQVAMLLGMDRFAFQRGNTAQSPSMNSGHCLQGMIGMAAVVERLYQQGRFSTLEDAVLQCMVDIGDRRVMAGVHYPSDNLCSWIIALSIAEHLFRTYVPEIRAAMWKAINKSIVFGCIERDVETTGPYKGLGPALAALQKAAL